MAPLALDQIRRDDLALSVGGAVAAANAAAADVGVDPAASLVTVTQDAGPGRVWRVHYGPRDYLRTRGGDLTVFIDEATGAVQRVLRGQ